MPAPLTTAPRLLAVAVLMVAGILLAGCSSPGGHRPPGSPGNEAGAVPNPSETPETDDAGYPSCKQVKAALGPAVDGLIELDDSENGVAVGSDGPSLTCSWFTPDTAGTSIHIEQYGGISLGISRDPDYTEDSMKPLGWNVDDPRVAAAGAWALKVGGRYKPSDQLDPTGVQVVRDGVVVVLTSGGVVLQDVPKLAALTNEWAMGAGVALLELMD